MWRTTGEVNVGGVQLLVRIHSYTITFFREMPWLDSEHSPFLKQVNTSKYKAKDEPKAAMCCGGCTFVLCLPRRNGTRTAFELSFRHRSPAPPEAGVSRGALSPARETLIAILLEE